MANFNGAGFTFPSPAQATGQHSAQYAPPFPTGFTQFTPNSTSGTTNIQFPSPPLSTPMLVNGLPSREGILSSASDSRPTASHRMAGSWQTMVPQNLSWMQVAEIPSSDANRFNAAAASYNSALVNSNRYK